MKLGIIGYGNLGKALVRGLVCGGISQETIIVNAKSERTRSAVREEFGQIDVTESKKELVEKADAIFLVVEPKNAPDVLDEIGEYELTGKVLISFMAGITLHELKQMMGDGTECDIIRVMPNIAIAEGKGILGVTWDEMVTDDVDTAGAEAVSGKREDIIALLGKLGYVLQVGEQQLDAITVTAASGLAFAASLMNAYQKAGKELLANEEQSREITLRVFENVIDLGRNENCSFEEIIERITTKGGTTEAGLKHLNQNAITETLMECMQKSYEKCRRIQE